MAATKPSLTALAPDKDGWYIIPTGTTAANLANMVPGTYEANPYPWGLPLVDTLTVEQQKVFTGKIDLDFPGDTAENRDYEFVKGVLVSDPMEEGQNQTDIENGRKPWKRKGNTIAELIKNIPSTGKLHVELPISKDNIIYLPKDAHLLTHFTGSIKTGHMPREILFDLEDGHYTKMTICRPPNSNDPKEKGATFIFISRSEKEGTE